MNIQQFPPQYQLQSPPQYQLQSPPQQFPPQYQLQSPPQQSPPQYQLQSPPQQFSMTNALGFLILLVILGIALYIVISVEMGSSSKTTDNTENENNTQDNTDDISTSSNYPTNTGGTNIGDTSGNTNQNPTGTTSTGTTSTGTTSTVTTPTVTTANILSNYNVYNSSFSTSNSFYGNYAITATNITVLHNNTYKLIITGNGTLEFIKYNPGWDVLFSSVNLYDKSRFYALIMKNDGDLVVIDSNNNILWRTYTSGNNGAYLSVTDGGVLVIRTNNNIIKAIYPTNYHILDQNNWKYIKNNDPTGCKTNWALLNTGGDIIQPTISKIWRNETGKSNGHLWCATDNNTLPSDRIIDTDLEPQTIHGIANISHIVLLNYKGERIYISASKYKNIIAKNSLDDDNNNWLECDKWDYSAINAYNINGDDITNLENSSKDMDKIFSYEISSYRRNYHFNSGYGAPHDNDNDLLHDGCTKFYNLYGNDKLTNQKNTLALDGFKSFNNTRTDHKNWLRWPRGASQYSYYWRVYYRTVDDYLTYLNSKS